jgi:hypothetical protein
MPEFSSCVVCLRRCDLTLMARMKVGMARLVRYASVSLSRRQTCQPKRFIGRLRETMSKNARTGGHKTNALAVGVTSSHYNFAGC